MKKNVLCLLMMAAVTVMVAAADYPMKDKENIDLTLPFSADATLRSLLVDNVFGTIELQGYDGNELRVKGVRTIQAETEGDLERARSQVKLETRQDNGRIGLIVSGPFRQTDGCVCWNKLGYIVQYDFVIQVPRTCRLDISTVNGDYIDIADIHGDFRVRNVNGRIAMSGIDGSGQASTVNGSVQVAFSRPPRENCSFQTVNGDVELEFAQSPSADFWCKTFNGSVYSDFDVTRLPGKAGQARRQDGRFVYKSDDFRGLRIGQGGTVIKMDSLNGDLLIAAGSKK